MTCPRCRTGETTLVYDGDIRAGGPGSDVESGYKIYTCQTCDATFIDPFPPDLIRYYSDEGYWESRQEGAKVDVERLLAKAGPEQLRWLTAIGTDVFRGKAVADFGAGAGAFLDLIGSVAKKTVAVELAEYLGKSLTERGHVHIHHSRDVEDESLDVIVSFDTLEHVEEPDRFMADCFRALRAGGQAFVGVPNREDFLRFVCPSYLPHFFHKAHLWYFSGACLERISAEAGFVVENAEYVHKYDLMNFVVWLRDGVGQGKKGSDLFDGYTEQAFSEHLERQGLASHVLVAMQKPAVGA